MENKIIVTGAGGFVGKYVCYELSKVGYKVVPFFRCTPKESSWKDGEYFIWPLGRGRRVERLPFLLDEIYGVVHLAANIDFGATEKQLLEDNLVATQEMLYLAEVFRVKKFVYMSSVGIYGQPAGKIIDEAYPVQCKTFYHQTKYWGEDMVAHYCQKFSLTGTIMRLVSPVGVGMKNNTFLPRILQKALRNEVVTLFGKGGRVQNYLDVREVARAVCLALEQTDTATYNLAADKSYTNREVAEICCKVTGSSSKIICQGTDVHEAERWLFNTDKLKGQLGFQNRYSLQDSIKWMAEFYENSGI